MNFRKFSLGCALFLLPLTIFAQSFVLRQIQFQGLQNLQPEMVRQLIHLHPGQKVTVGNTDAVLKALFKSGYFHTVQLRRRGAGTLLVVVKERPMISQVRLEGNQNISDDKIQPVLKKVGIATGRMLDPMKLQLFCQSLAGQYAQMGYQATTVTPQVQPLGHQRVAVTLNVREGKIVKVSSITFSGNHHFSARKLRSTFDLTTPGLTTWLTHKDRFSQFQLAKDLQQLTDFYFDHGYARFSIQGQKITYSKDRQRVSLLIHVNEGEQYQWAGAKLTGNLLQYRGPLEALITIVPGTLFSKTQLIQVQKSIESYLSDRSYAFATVRMVPRINTATRRVFVTYDVSVGKPVYIRHVFFTGNAGTDQAVLRRRVLTLEASAYSQQKVQQSKRQLLMLPYIGQVTVTKTPVAYKENQVDIAYHVVERPAGKASIQGGWSSAYGFLYGASISQPNFMGSGKSVSLGFQNSAYTQNYNLSYDNPYYTLSGISRGFSVFYNHTRYNKAYNFSPYLMDSFGASVNYSFPLSRYTGFGVDIGYTHLALSHILNDLQTTAGVVRGSMARSVIDFLNGSLNNPSPVNLSRDYDVAALKAGWTYNSLNRYFMPTRGVSDHIGVELGLPIIGSGALRYYKVSNRLKAYLPLTHGFILSLLSNIGYGRGYGSRGALLPFFYNYYAGGIGTVPGYAQNSLGPRYAPGSHFYGSSLGGNLLVTAGVHLILPNFISDTVRIAATFDIGNVFQSGVYAPDRTEKDIKNPTQNLVINNQPFAFNQLRMSAGMLVVWNLPMMGPVDLSFAFPLNKKPGDSTETFQFAMGISF